MENHKKNNLKKMPMEYKMQTNLKNGNAMKINATRECALRSGASAKTMNGSKPPSISRL